LWKAAVSGSMRTSCQHSVPLLAAGKKPLLKQEWNGCRESAWKKNLDLKTLT